MNDGVDVTIRAGIADVRLARSSKMNALDEAMFDGLVDAAERLAGQPGLRAVVLSGNGKAFCAGIDLNSLRELGGVEARGRLLPRTHGIANKYQQAVWAWRTLPVPVIAAIHGVALGGGFQLALGADMRYAAPGTRFSILEMNWGLVPDMAGSLLMRHLARDDVIRELTYTGRRFLAEEALTLGFITRVCEEPLGDALAMAQEIAANSPDAMRAAKRLYNAAVTLDSARALMAESVEQDQLIGHRNQLEAVMANLEKRAPRFED